MTFVARRRTATRAIVLDRSLEALPVFRLSDSAEDTAISFSPESGGRWRVLPSPGDRLPGTFDQDVYIELLHRYHEAGAPEDGVIAFTLHAFLRSIGRRVDGRTYEQLRSALARLQHTTLESQQAYFDGTARAVVDSRFNILTGVVIERRRFADRDQLGLFSAFPASEPGEAYVTMSPIARANIAAGYTVLLSAAQYMALSSPVARRLYRLFEVAHEEGMDSWRVTLAHLA